MPVITFQPSGKTIDVPPGTELLNAAHEAGVSIESPCGSTGTCGACLVRVVAGEVRFDNLEILPQNAIDEGFVLACQTHIMNTPVTFEVPEQDERKEGKFDKVHENLSLIRHELLPKKEQLNALAHKWYLEIPAAQREDGLSDRDRLTREIQKSVGKKEVIYPLAVIRSLAETLRAEEGQITVTLICEQDQYHVIQLESGQHTAQHFGLAVDLGTTTISVQLVSLSEFEVISTQNDYNDQLKCGLDVISRINYAKRPERLEELRVRVLETINRLAQKAAEEHGIALQTISNSAISGNTTMIHLLLGLNPEYLRLEPYTPTLLEVPLLTAQEVGLQINPQSWVHISPNVGSYVGGDITAGVLCSDLATDSEELNLFIDIGTNGELVLGNCDFLLACACSAGPAFEGSGVDHGMRASHGAIERVEIDPDTGVAQFWTIGNQPPKGICGSGMISLLANLFLSGWLDAAGKFNRAKACKAIQVKGRQAHYIIAHENESATGKPITISELDINNIIRAKAAIYAACALMLQHVEMSFEDLAHVYIAGGFGRFIDLEKAIVIGLIPDIPRAKFQFIGNSSLMGTHMVLVSQEYRKKQLKLAQNMTNLELSTDPRYMDQYTAALFLPNTHLELFPSVKFALNRR
ncbi:ASKHA domain-containing protein [Deltaproteobacteria bacterium TL4]